MFRDWFDTEKADIKYNKESADFVSLQAIQLAILDEVFVKGVLRKVV